MMRKLITAAAQMGPIAKLETRANTVTRLLEMMREARGRGCELVVFTEPALTTFFPCWMIEDEAELNSYYETEMPSAATQPLFDGAKKLGIGFYLGYAELRIESGILNRAIWDFRSSKALMATWAWRFAMIGAGSKPTA